MMAVLGSKRRLKSQTSIDYYLLAATIILTLFGLTSLYSQGSHVGSFIFFRKQILNLTLGFIPAIALYLINPKFWIRVANVLYVINLLGLIAVLKMGTSVNGSERWINLGPLEIQPSELAKLFIILTLASFYAIRVDSIEKPSTFFIGLVHVLIPMILIIKQPHLGATMVLAFVWFAISAIAGVPWKFLIGALVVAVLVLGVGIMSPKLMPGLIHGYHEKRLDAFIDGGSNKGSDYQTTRAMIALGVGGVTGDGFGKGSEGPYIPEQQTDFIFTVLGEELGLVGSILLVFSYGLLFYRLWLLTVHSSDVYYRMIGIGLLSMLSFHTFVNLLMVTKLLPVIGLWLPFMSYGGTAMWLCMSSIGLALNLSRREADRSY